MDFQKLVTGPPGPVPNPLAGEAYPRVAYMCYNKPIFDLTGTVPARRFAFACATSYDGGGAWVNERTFGQHIEVAGVTPVTGCRGGAFMVAVAPDGTVVARGQPDCMVRTRDSGATWQVVGPGPDSGSTWFAFDANGTLYSLSAYWEGPLSISVSRDQGTTWEKPYPIQPPGTHAPMFATIVAGAKGRLFVPFWGTIDNITTAFDGNRTTRWHAWLLGIEGADGPQPTVTALQATPDDAPMHIGPGGADMRGRLFLGDFVTGSMAPDGTPYVVFPQSCNDGCQGNPDAKDTDARVLGTVVALQGWNLKG